MRASILQQISDPVRYSATRDEILHGDIVLFRGRGILSRLIRWFTDSPYSHSGIVARWHDRVLVLEATGPGVVATPLSRVVQRYDGAVELWTTDEELDRDKVVCAALEELGKKYSKWALVRGLRKILFGIRAEPDPWHPPEKFVCSQYVSYVYNAGGLDLREDENDEFTTPGQIADAVATRKVGDLCTDELASRFELRPAS